MHIQSCRCPVCRGIGTAKNTQAIPQCGSLVVSSSFLQRTSRSRRKGRWNSDFLVTKRPFFLSELGQSKNIQDAKSNIQVKGGCVVPYCTLQNCEPNIFCKLKRWPSCPPCHPNDKATCWFCQVAIVQWTLLLGNGLKVISTTKKISDPC